MIAASAPVIVSIWLLAAASIIQTIFISQTNRRQRQQSDRIHELEMERDFPGWKERQRLEEAMEWHRENGPGAMPPDV